MKLAYLTFAIALVAADAPSANGELGDLFASLTGTGVNGGGFIYRVSPIQGVWHLTEAITSLSPMLTGWGPERSWSLHQKATGVFVPLCLLHLIPIRSSSRSSFCRLHDSAHRLTQGHGCRKDTADGYISKAAERLWSTILWNRPCARASW